MEYRNYEVELFALMRDVMAVMRGRAARCCEAYGLTLQEAMLLFEVMERGPATQNCLGQRMHIAKSALSPLCKRLEAEGFLLRCRRPQDERYVNIRLTERGEAAAGEICADLSRGALFARRPNGEERRRMEEGLALLHELVCCPGEALPGEGGESEETLQ